MFGFKWIWSFLFSWNLHFYSFFRSKFKIVIFQYQIQCAWFLFLENLNFCVYRIKLDLIHHFFYSVEFDLLNIFSFDRICVIIEPLFLIFSLFELINTLYDIIEFVIFLDLLISDFFISRCKLKLKIRTIVKSWYTIFFRWSSKSLPKRYIRCVLFNHIWNFYSHILINLCCILSHIFIQVFLIYIRTLLVKILLKLKL
jgi:hypothetical protein